MSCQSAQNEALITTLFNAASVVASRMNERNPNPSQQRLGGVMVIAQVGEDPFMVAQKIQLLMY